MNSYTGKQLVAKLGLALALFISPCPSLTAASVNLLPNADFTACSATPNIPDNWGMLDWLPLGLYIDGWGSDIMSIDHNVSGPIKGAAVIRLHYPPKEKIHAPDTIAYIEGRIAIFLTHSRITKPIATNHKRTLSVYAKSDREGTPLYFADTSSYIKATFSVGTEWQRLSFTGTSAEAIDKLCFTLGNYDSRVWLTAPQLEEGEQSTAFQPPETQPARLFYPPFTAANPIPSSYKILTQFDYYTTEPEAQCRILNVPNSVQSLQLKIVDKSGNPVGPIVLIARAPSSTILIGTPSPFGCAIPIGNLPAGSYRIEVSTGSGQSTITTAPLVKLPPSSTEVKCNRFSRTLQMNGKPIFPAFLPIQLNHLNENAFIVLKNAGFNAICGMPGIKLSIAEILDHGLTAEQISKVRKYLDDLYSHGFVYFWWHDWAVKDWDKQADLLHGDIRGYASVYSAIISRFKDHPAIAGWYIIDEPTQHGWADKFGYKEADLAIFHDLVKAADPYRPAFINTYAWTPGSGNQQNTPFGGFASSDIVWHDTYYTTVPGLDLEKMAPWAQMVNIGKALDYPQIEWVSGSYGPPEISASARPAAIRVFNWLLYVNGTRGIGYWQSPSIVPEAWSEMSRFNTEARALTEGPLSAPDASMVASGTANPRIHYSIWRSGGYAYVLAVSTAEQATQFQLDLGSVLKRSIGTVQRYFEKSSVSVSGGKIIDTIPALERAVYVVQLK